MNNKYYIVASNLCMILHNKSHILRSDFILKFGIIFIIIACDNSWIKKPLREREREREQEREGGRQNESVQ